MNRESPPLSAALSALSEFLVCLVSLPARSLRLLRSRAAVFAFLGLAVCAGLAFGRGLGLAFGALDFTIRLIT